ncbi:uncharacterized protein LOC133554902 [Nerophis ophidion]|uniref:uncharacterized protein LOC133554902 n=1 Tax=Nerophis ophidion TaxID=159077 RepID=UPI002AE01E3C|nr:uncharacterized protein LOC133554902 [Nerophis ophidion]
MVKQRGPTRGWRPCCAVWLRNSLTPGEIEVATPSTQAHLRRCRRVWRSARASLLKASVRMCRNANRRRIPAPDYQPGQQVLLRAKDLHLPISSQKLAPRFVGPYTVKSKINPAAVQLDLPHSMRSHPVFHVSQVKPVVNSPLSAPTPAPPPPRVLEDGDQVWTVKEILKVRRQGRGWVYLVDWEGYGPEDRSWVPASYIADPSLIKDFYRAHPEAPRSSPGVSRKRGGAVMGHTPASSLPAMSPPAGRPDKHTTGHSHMCSLSAAGVPPRTCKHSPNYTPACDERAAFKSRRSLRSDAKT